MGGGGEGMMCHSMYPSERWGSTSYYNRYNVQAKYLLNCIFVPMIHYQRIVLRMITADNYVATTTSCNITYCNIVFYFINSDQNPFLFRFGRHEGFLASYQLFTFTILKFF